MNILIAIPLFIIAHQNLIELNWIFNLDRIPFLTYDCSDTINTKALRNYHYMYIYIHPGFILWTASGNYGFNSVFEDYDSMLYTMSDNPNPQDIIIVKLPFPNKSKIINAIEYENPQSKNFAVMATSEHFKYKRLL
jgi:hypothetical protein